MNDVWVNEFINIPFVEKGRSREGCDCWGLATVIYKEKLNIDLPLLLDYDSTRDCKNIAELYNYEHLRWQEIPLGEEKPFDIIIIKINSFPTHVGIIYEKGLMIHCEKNIGTHVSEYYKEHQLKNRIVGIYRYE